MVLSTLRNKPKRINCACSRVRDGEIVQSGGTVKNYRTVGSEYLIVNEIGCQTKGDATSKRIIPRVSRIEGCRVG